MKLKTVTARTMAQALAEVRRHIGTHAVILHTRQLKQGGFLGIGARSYVELTAADGRELGRRQPASESSQRQRQRELEQAARSNLAQRRQAQTPRPSPSPPDELAGDLIKRTYAAARAEFQPQTQSTATPITTNPAATTAPAATATLASSESSHQLATEMRAIRKMVARMGAQNHRLNPVDATNRDGMPDTLFEQYLALLEQEVSEELVREVIDQVRGQLDESALEDEQQCRDAVAGAVARLLPDQSEAAKTISASASPGRPRVIALVGPTGVGKTTTVAKLAATFKLKQHKSVGLITIDTYRIAAVDQLKTYANIIDIPLQVVQSADQMQRAVSACADCDVVLIDTAGRSQRDDPRLEELQQFIAAAEPDEVHLVLSSTCSQGVLMDTIDRFSRIETDRLIFTKLDEAVTFGVVLNVMRKARKRLSYITTGQEVPHQIEPGRGDRLAQLVLGESTVKS